METGIIDDYMSVQECVAFFAKEGYELIKTTLTDGGLRRGYEFEHYEEYGYEKTRFYFSINNRKIFLGIGADAEPHRLKMSKVVHSIIQKMNDLPCTKLIELVEGKWYKLGASVVPIIERYEYLVNPRNYKSIKREIKEAFQDIPYNTQPEGITIIFIYGEEAKNLVRVLKVLGYITDEIVDKKKQVQVVLKSEFKNRDLFKEQLIKLGYSMALN